MTPPHGQQPTSGAPRTEPLTLGNLRARAQASKSLVEPVMLIVIGLALGLVDQTSSEVSGVLRVPALIAALILVGQGINVLEQARQGEEVNIMTPEQASVPAGASERSSQRPPADGEVNRGIDPDAQDDGGGGTRALLILGLAIWLGLATLAFPTAPLSLILLSLLAAYLLFARGWKLMAPAGQR